MSILLVSSIFNKRFSEQVGGRMLMVGRLEELKQLEKFYNSSKFEFLTLYGRRRIGKTTILREFAGRHRAMFFSAQEKNDSLNLLDFSKVAQTFFEGSFIYIDFRIYTFFKALHSRIQVSAHFYLLCPYPFPYSHSINI